MKNWLFFDESTNSHISNVSNEKLKFVYLKKQNPLGINVITFRSEIPPEFRLDDYVDYDMMFSKAYLEPLQSLLNVVGWSVKEQATLEGLFGWNSHSYWFLSQ